MQTLFSGDWLLWYMPITGVEVFWPGLVVLGFAVGIIGGFLGIGGAWMITPGLNVLGFPMPFAIGTDMAHIAGKSIISSVRHARFGNVDAKLATFLLIGSLPGIELGAQTVMTLERAGIVESVLHALYIAILALITLVVFWDRQRFFSLRNGISFRGLVYKVHLAPMARFHRAEMFCSVWVPVCAGLATGYLSGLLGIGGGILRLPVLLYLFGCATHVAVGTDLFCVLVTSLYATFSYTAKGRIELAGVFFLLSGAAVGAQIGAVATKYVRGYGIRRVFGLSVLSLLCSVLLAHFGMSLTAVSLVFFSTGGLAVYIVCALVRGARKEAYVQEGFPAGGPAAQEQPKATDEEV